MRITLKRTVVASSSLAVSLNLMQFALQYEHISLGRFQPSWALADSASTAPVPTSPSLPVLSDRAPGTTQPTSSVVTEPSGLAAVEQALRSTGLDPSFASLYLEAQQRTGTPWQLLAAVHETETGQSGDTADTSYAGATGPMQFEPATFDRYATTLTPGTMANIDSVGDAIMTAGRYLALSGAASGRYSQALYAYNHSTVYVDQVLGLADSLGL